MSAVHQVYAQIFEETIQDIRVYSSHDEADHFTKCKYGDLAFAVDCLRYPCQVGDRYMDETFYHVDLETGEETVIMPTCG